MSTTTTRRVTTYAIQNAHDVRTNSRMLDLANVATLAEAQEHARQWTANSGSAHRIVARPVNARGEDQIPAIIGTMTREGWKNATSTETLSYLNEHIGHYWFSKETMRFFKSKVYGPVYGTEHGRFLFVSSEKRDDERRRFTIREMEPNGSVETVGEFQAYGTYKAAEKAIAALLAQ